MKSAGNNGIKTILISYLSDKSPKYSQTTVRVLNSDPLRFSADNGYYFESLTLQKLVNQAGGFEKAKFITLKDWSFEFNKVPGSHGFYFDISVKDFEILEEFEGETTGEETIVPKNILEDKEVKFNFEVKKRKEIGDLYRKLKESPLSKKKGRKAKTERLSAKTENLIDNNLMPLDDLISAEPPIFFEENSGCSSLNKSINNLQEQRTTSSLKKRGIKSVFDEDDEDAEYVINEKKLSNEKLRKFKDLKFSQATIEFLDNHSDIIKPKQ